MSDFIDRLPAREREKLRKRLRSPEEYERLREKVRGPEDLEREMEKNAEFAEAKLHLESDEKAQKGAREIVRKAIQEKGIESSIDMPRGEENSSLRQGAFEITVSEKAHVPHLAIRVASSASEDVSSSKVQETFPLTPVLQKQVLAYLKKHAF